MKIIARRFIPERITAVFDSNQTAHDELVEKLHRLKWSEFRLLLSLVVNMFTLIDLLFYKPNE
jgi:hypothetical protein